MKLTTGQAYAVFIFAKEADEQIAAGKLTFSGRARIANIVNRRLLAPIVEAFETIRNERFKELLSAEDFAKLEAGTLPMEQHLKLMPVVVELQKPVCDVAIMQYRIEDIRLDENPKFVLSDTVVLLLEDFPGAQAAA